MNLVLAAVLSIAVGLSLGLLGGGGSILTVPILVYVVHLDAKSAIATSLLVVGATSGVATTAHARAGRVRWRAGAAFGLASMTGAFLGGRLAHGLPGAALLAAFTGIMIVTGLAMLRPRRAPPPAQGPTLARTLAVGAATGTVTGLVGAGGGFVIVPALAMFCGLGMKEAVATSLLVITMSSFAGFAGHVGQSPIDLTVALSVTAAAVLGSFVGVRFAGRVRPESLRRGFAWFILAMATLMAYQQLRALFAR